VRPQPWKGLRVTRDDGPANFVKGNGTGVMIRAALDDCSGGVKQLSTRADVDIARSVEDEIGSAEGAVGAF
jgi:hypothetical protein